MLNSLLDDLAYVGVGHLKDRSASDVQGEPLQFRVARTDELVRKRARGVTEVSAEAAREPFQVPCRLNP